MSKSDADNNAKLTAQSEGQICVAKFKAAVDLHGSSLEFWKCADQAMLKMEVVIDPADIDIYQGEAAQNEVAAAEFDSGRISREEAASLFNADTAEANSALRSREIAREH